VHESQCVFLRPPSSNARPLAAANGSNYIDPECRQPTDTGTASRARLRRASRPSLAMFDRGNARPPRGSASWRKNPAIAGRDRRVARRHQVSRPAPAGRQFPQQRTHGERDREN
jgi:hypothetical protein